MSDKEHYIINARKLFAELEQGKFPDSRPGLIRKALQNAGADAAALDPEGKKSADEMDAALKEATKKAYIIVARELFAELNSLARSWDV
jgi:hypothetical protein